MPGETSSVMVQSNTENGEGGEAAHLQRARFTNCHVSACHIAKAQVGRSLHSATQGTTSASATFPVPSRELLASDHRPEWRMVKGCGYSHLHGNASLKPPVNM